MTPLALANSAKYKLLGGLQTIFPWMARPRYHEGVVWSNDRAWAVPYLPFLARDGRNGYPASRILDRRFFVIQIAMSVADLPGSTAECGVRYGVGSALICQTLRSTYAVNARHFAFDSFEGLSEPDDTDRAPSGKRKWWKGKLKTDVEVVRDFLRDFSFCQVVPGWIPEGFPIAAQQRFRLVHIDVDLRQPTWDSLQFFYPRMVRGGVLLLDDHGFTECPGARKAAQDFFADKPEKIVEVPTGQAFIVKQ